MNNLLLISLISFSMNTYADEVQKIVCKDGDGENLELILEKVGYSSWLNTKITASGTIWGANGVKYQLKPLVVDESLRCLLGSSSPLLLKCRGKKTFGIELGQESELELETNFEIKEIVTKTISFDKTEEFSTSLIDYSVDSPKKGFLKSFDAPAIIEKDKGYHDREKMFILPLNRWKAVKMKCEKV